MKKHYISIVIPCYGSEKSLEVVVNELLKQVKKRNNKYEIILVNDCSPDGVWRVIEKLCRVNENIIGINLAKNFGQHAALMAGYRESKGDLVVSLDDDGQNDPSEFWKLIDKIDEGYDVVYGRYSNKDEGFVRNIGSKMNSIMRKIFIDNEANVNGSSYNVIRRYVIDEMIKYPNSYTYIGGLVFRTTNNIGEVELIYHDRISGKSGYTLKKLFGIFMNGFSAFSIKPLKAATYLGFVTTICGSVYAIIIIIGRLTNAITEIGYASIMATMLFIGGIIMVILGLIGEYIGRIYICINKSPQYVVKNKIKNKI